MNNFPGILASNWLGWCNKSLVRRGFAEVSRWVQEGADIKSNLRRGSREYP